MNVCPGPGIKEVLTYDRETGLFRFAIRVSNRFRAGDLAGTTKHPRGYVYIKHMGSKYMAHHLAWYFEYGVWPGKLIDHINGVKSDNRIANLRLATKSQNGANLVSARGPMKGVRLRQYAGGPRWISYIQKDGTEHYLGTFLTPGDAQAAYAAAAVRLFGEFARFE